ncbi:MAG: putative addiction module antidote protein [Simkaniaceae bacterium]|nr:putative addiction module antidote protein [Candidatus Sacchlamyda saccharinae]
MAKKIKRINKTKSYTEHLFQRLKNPKEAAAYLNAALEDEDPRVFLVALKDVTEAHGGMTKLARETELNRENLYRTLSTRGNPRLDSLVSILEGLNLHISIEPAI